MGSSFRVYLPAIQVDWDDSTSPAAAPPLEGTGVVLLVDDDDAMRLFARSALETYGYDVVEAVNGEAALAILHERREEFDGVVLDLTMPVMSGPQCLAEIRALDPNVPVILTSGFDEVEAARRQR